MAAIVLSGMAQAHLEHRKFHVSKSLGEAADNV